MENKAILEMTADIVASHASMNELTNDELLSNIDKVFAKLSSLAGEGAIAIEASTSSEPEVIKPAVPLEAAFAPDKIFCMVCGKAMKTLKRHLSSEHGLKPGQYRKQFGIPTATPLVAKEYSDKRKTMSASQDLKSRLEKARAARKYNRGNKFESEAAVVEKAPKVKSAKANKTRSSGKKD